MACLLYSDLLWCALVGCLHNKVSLLSQLPCGMLEWIVQCCSNSRNCTTNVACFGHLIAVISSFKSGSSWPTFSLQRVSAAASLCRHCTQRIYISYFERHATLPNSGFSCSCVPRARSQVLFIEMCQLHYIGHRPAHGVHEEGAQTRLRPLCPNTALLAA